MKTTILAVAALTALLSGCTTDEPAAATGGATVSSPPPGDPFDNVVRYAECLRTEGLQIAIHQGDGYTMPKDTDPRKLAAAEAACRSVAPPGMYQKPSAKQLDHDVRLARCLRDRGVRVEDPTSDQPQLRINHAPANLRQLTDACEKKIGDD